MAKKIEAAYRVPLFDRIFKPETITLPNGHTVSRPRSRTPLIAAILIAVVWASIQLTGFDIGIIIRRGHQFTYILARIFHPNFSYFGKVVGPLLDTIKMSILGSVLGATLALPFAVVASTNINKSALAVSLCRFLLNIIRTLPTLVIAKFAALIFGLGTFAGTVAITVFTFMGSWNDFNGPLIYLYDANKYTLSLGLSFFKGLYTSKWNLLMAATVLVMLPILIIFFLAQDYIINGISISSGTKG